MNLVAGQGAVDDRQELLDLGSCLDGIDHRRFQKVIERTYRVGGNRREIRRRLARTSGSRSWTIFLFRMQAFWTNSMSDPRFASYWGDVDTRIDAATKRLAKRHFAFGEALDMVATLGAPSPALARLFQDRGYQSGSAFLPGLTGVDDSEYYETLADRWHLRDLAARWLATTPFTATHAKDGALAEFLVLGTALPQAREIACRTGQPVFLMIAGDGTLTVQQTFS